MHPTISSPSPRFSESFDVRLLGLGAAGLVAFVLAAFLGLAAANNQSATAGGPVYDDAGSSRWPRS